jgi:hypothetical protein
MILGYKFRVYANQAQTAALDDMLGDFCQLSERIITPG